MRKVTCILERLSQEVNDAKSKEQLPSESTEIYSCARCGKEFSTKNHLRKHLRFTHEIHRLHRCIDCGKTFTSAHYLDIHAVFHKPPQLSCTDCGKKFFRQRNLQCHIGIAHRGKRFHRGNDDKSAQFTCPICQKLFNTANCLQAHLSLGHKPKQSKCSLCEAEFTRPFKLEKHLLAVHSIAVTEHTKCDICGTEFRSRAGLICHKRFHSSRTVACSQCDSEFYTQGGLAAHFKSHHSNGWQMPTELSINEPNYTCAVCCRPFGVTGKNKLRMHLRIHYQKPVECLVCKRIFNSKKTLTNHIRLTHKFDDEFRCHVCKKKFKNRQGVHVHMMFHRAPLYHCSQCQQSFYTAALLFSHTTTEHTKWPMPTVLSTEQPSYNCAICCRPFNRGRSISDKKTFLRSHLRIHYRTAV